MPAEQVRTIIVVGATGSGKSETIKQLGGRHVQTKMPPEISDGFESCTIEAATYDVGVFGGARYHFVDTMGMLDTNGNDAEGLEKIARLVNNLSTVVGVVYVVQGRMSPPEIETCNLLFRDFFHDLPSSKLLVLKTNVKNWESYDMQKDKDYLRKQNGVPKRILDADFLAVDFNDRYGASVLEEMTSRIWQRTRSYSWSTYVDLSDKSEIAVKYYALRKCRKLLEEELKRTREEVKKSREETNMLRKDYEDKMEKMRKTNTQLEIAKAKLEGQEEELRRRNKELTRKIDDHDTFKKLVANTMGGAAGGAIVAGLLGSPAGLPLLAAGGLCYLVGNADLLTSGYK